MTSDVEVAVKGKAKRRWTHRVYFDLILGRHIKCLVEELYAHTTEAYPI